MFGFGKKNKEKSINQDVSQESQTGSQDIEQSTAVTNENENNAWLSKLKAGLSKSSSKISNGVKDILVRTKLDDAMLEELEELLITADLGVKTASFICQELAKQKHDKNITVDEVKSILASEIAKILDPITKPLKVNTAHKPHVIVMAGVNGTGKTTTIGKLASHFQSDGKKVMLAACDTFRAAAVEQLNVWSQRVGCPVITGENQADPASVAYTAFEKAKNESADVLIIDTAGRLQNKTNLMEQLAKIIKVIKKIDANAPHDNVIVLDATTGQNANSQVKVFKEMIDISGIIVTKLDGTAKGGVVVALAREFALPIHAVGIGEGIDDLRHFNAESFAKELVGA